MFSAFKLRFAFVLLIFPCLLVGGPVWAQGSYPTEVQITFDQPGFRANDVYAPRAIYQTIGGVQTLVIYFGGWYATNPNTLPHDAIYRMVCSSPTSCGAPVKVLDPITSAGFQSAGLLNNPSIVELHNGGQDYYVMYMTGVNSTDPNAGYNTVNQQIYYSTSYANDGVNWSAPQLLITNAYLPSATIGRNGHVLLYVNSNGASSSLPFTFYYDLGTSGVSYVTSLGVTTNTGDYYFNVDISYNASIGFSQVVGRKLFLLPNGQIDTTHVPQIDYLDDIGSNTGSAWNVRNTNIEPGGMSPGAHPGTYCWVYYGKQTGSLTSNIYFRSWC